MIRRIRTVLPLACSLAVLCGCASTTSVEPTLDERTGITWFALPEPIAMAHDTRAISTSARKYMYLGPVEMNVMGKRQDYLWLGMGSTLESVILADDTQPNVLLLEVDGIPFELPLSEWDAATPYAAPAPITRSMKARVTLDQIVRIASASDVRAMMVMPDGKAEPYEHWNGVWSAWTDFRNAVDPFGAISGSVVSN
jgi:hypothetical protein